MNLKFIPQLQHTKFWDFVFQNLGVRCPKSVLAAAANRKRSNLAMRYRFSISNDVGHTYDMYVHAHMVVGQLRLCYIDHSIRRLDPIWRELGKSSIHMDFLQRTGHKKKGKRTYFTFKDLLEKFGNAARAMQEKKYELEKSNKDPATPWWRPRPELPNDKDLHPNFENPFP